MSIALIHWGIVPVSPAFGRVRHCLTARSRTSTPKTSLSHDESVDGPVLVLFAWPTRTSTRLVTTTMPATQPIRKPVLVRVAFFDSSIRMTAMIGIGLIAPYRVRQQIPEDGAHRAIVPAGRLPAVINSDQRGRLLRSQSHQASTPAPVRALTSRVIPCGLTFRRLARNRSRS